MPESLRLSPGARLGPYEIVESLGAGGMGEVYRARDPRLEREVALKVLPREVAGDPENLRRFQREAKALAALSHPNIVTVHSVEEAEGVHFLTMELVEGKTLAEAIPSGGLPLERFLDISIPLADAVAAAHARGVIHRDLKPGNVMVGDEGRVTVLDFGLARPGPGREDGVTSLPTETLEQLTREGQVLGTVPYMAPEQLQGEPATAQSDIFSLGAGLYEMATGERPFAGESGADLMSSILRDQPASVSEVRPELPRQLGRIVGRCLAKKPERRFQTALDVRNELDQLREEVSSGPGVADRPLRGSSSHLRRRLLLGAAVVGLLFLVGVLTVRHLTGPQGAPTPGEGIDSVAILPFESATGDPAMEYLSDGIAATLLNRLATVPTLRVAPRALAFRSRDPREEPRATAARLDVRGLVTGRVEVVGDRIVVSAELVDALEPEQLWGDIYTRSRSDLVELQSQLAADIARELRPRLDPEHGKRVGQRETEDAQAYELYLKAAHLLDGYQGNNEDLERALALGLEAVERDPSFAAAQATVARAYMMLGFWRLMPAGEASSKAWERARVALELEPELPVAQAIIGHLTGFVKWEWEEGMELVRRALKLAPDDPVILIHYSALLPAVDELDEALAAARRAYELDPLNPTAAMALSWALYQQRRFGEAIERMEELLELDPTSSWARSFRWRAMAYSGRGEEAIAEAERAGIPELARPSGVGVTDVDLATLYAAAGMEKAARRIVAQYPPDEVPARAWAELGEKEKAFRGLRRLIEERRSNTLAFLKTAPAWDPVRGDPRFVEILREVGLPHP